MVVPMLTQASRVSASMSARSCARPAARFMRMRSDSPANGDLQLTEAHDEGGLAERVVALRCTGDVLDVNHVKRPRPGCNLDVGSAAQLVRIAQPECAARTKLGLKIEESLT